MKRLIKILKDEDIPVYWRSSPMGALVRFCNLNQSPPQNSEPPSILIGVCPHEMKPPRLPENFAFVLDCETAEFRLNDFFISYALAIGQARAIALVGCPACLEPADIVSAEGQRLQALYPNIQVACFLRNQDDGTLAGWDVYFQKHLNQREIK